MDCIFLLKLKIKNNTSFSNISEPVSDQFVGLSYMPIPMLHVENIQCAKQTASFLQGLFLLEAWTDKNQISIAKFMFLMNRLFVRAIVDLQCRKLSRKYTKFSYTLSPLFTMYPIINILH